MGYESLTFQLQYTIDVARIESSQSFLKHFLRENLSKVKVPIDSLLMIFLHFCHELGKFSAKNFRQKIIKKYPLILFLKSTFIPINFNHEIPFHKE